MGETLKTATIKSLFWKFLEQGGASLITLVVQIVMARLLAPEEFGVLAIMLVFVNIGNVIVQSGLNTAIIQASDATEDDYSTVFWMSLTLSLIMYAAVFCFAPVIADFYSMPSIVAPLRVLVLVLVINAFNSIQEAIVARHLDFRKTFKATVAAAVASGVLGIGVALAGGGIWALVVQQLVQQLVKCAVLALQLSWKPRLVFQRGRAKRYFQFGWKLLVSGLLDQGYQSLSDLIIGKVFTSADLGFVSQGKKYPQALGNLLDGAIQPVMLSAVSRVQDEAATVKRLARRGLKTSTFLIFPCMTLFAVVAEPLVGLLLGEKWLPCVPFLQAYCLIYALLPIHTTNLQALNGMGRSDLFLKLEIIKNVLGLVIVLFAAFVLQDLNAVIIGSVISNIACTFINAAPNKRVIGYSYREQLLDICPALFLSLAAGMIAYPLGNLFQSSLVIVVVDSFVLLGSYVLMARLFHLEEYSYLVRTLKEIRMGRNKASN